MIVYAIISLVVFLLLPDTAFAWGPGMHMHVAMMALGAAALAAPPIRSLMEKFPDDFLYGSVVPDIVVGKKFAGYIHHCHNWRIGWQILKKAGTERQRAAAYGYLMHLAADVVAHNYYIPFKIIKSYKTRLLHHTYWEMRFDIGVPEKVWRHLGKVTSYELGEFDMLLERVLKRTLFSYKTNKRIFSSLLIIQKIRGLRHSLKLYAKQSRYLIGEENRQHYIDLSAEAALDFLAHPKTAACLEVDPTGTSRLEYAKRVRRQMKHLWQSDSLKDKDASRLIEMLKERLAMGLYRPDLVLPHIGEFL